MGKLTLKEVVEKLYMKHGDCVSIDGTTFIDVNHRARFIDKDYGEWWALVNNVINKGSGHTKRRDLAGAKRTTIKLTKEDFDRLLPKYITIVYEDFTLISKPCTFIDEIYGEWHCEPSRVLAGSRHSKRSAKENPQTQPLSIDEIKKRLLNTHGDLIVIKEDTYKGISKKAIFIHKIFGEWPAFPYTVISGSTHPTESTIKRKETNFKKYGFEHTTQVPEFALMVARSSNNSITKLHWKTGEELVCQGSYESKTVDYLNTKMIGFEWQPKTFKMPNGKTYRPDLYLIDQDLWIEIKGYMRGDAQEKWDWFKTVYPTAQLWNKEKLKEIGIL